MITNLSIAGIWKLIGTLYVLWFVEVEWFWGLTAF